MNHTAYIDGNFERKASPRISWRREDDVANSESRQDVETAEQCSGARRLCSARNLIGGTDYFLAALGYSELKVKVREGEPPDLQAAYKTAKWLETLKKVSRARDA